jgi:hypothetical protein
MAIVFATAIAFLIKSNYLLERSNREQDSYQSVILFYASKRHNKIAMTLLVIGFIIVVSIFYENIIEKSIHEKKDIIFETYD